MNMHHFEPREGGVKIVFDVSEATVEEITRAVTDADFKVERYYHPDDEHRPGGSAPGAIRLGAERPAFEFTDAEEARIVAAFDAVQRAAGFACDRVGVDVWTAGGDGPADVREPRRPMRPIDAEGAAVPLPY